MSLTTAEWHQRYLQQARWTQNLRAYLYRKAGLEQTSSLLDIGCGTGVLEHELLISNAIRIFALDIDRGALNFACQVAPQAIYTQGDALTLPYADQVFDMTFCHFLLLWIKNPYQTVAEMVRVTRANGCVLALAEPDYGGRIDFPPELSKIGAWQAAALHQQGANPHMGRELRSIFYLAGLADIEVGVMGGQWGMESSYQDTSLEWDVIRSDLSLNREFLSQSEQLKALDIESRENGQRVLFVPTFYAVGIVKR